MAYLLNDVHYGKKGSTPTFQLHWQDRRRTDPARQTELARVKPPRGCWGQVGRGYEVRWPEAWLAELDAKVIQSIMPVTKVCCR